MLRIAEHWTTEYCWALLDIAENCWTLLTTALLDVAEHCWILLSTAEHCWVLLNIVEHCWTLFSTSEHCWPLYLSTTEHCWTLLSISNLWCLFFVRWFFKVSGHFRSWLFRILFYVKVMFNFDFRYFLTMLSALWWIYKQNQTVKKTVLGANLDMFTGIKNTID